MWGHRRLLSVLAALLVAGVLVVVSLAPWSGQVADDRPSTSDKGAAEGVTIADCEDGSQAVRVMTFNIRWGSNDAQEVDLPAVAEVISDADADVVALQEVDDGVFRSDHVAQVEQLGQLTGLTPVFAGIVSLFDGRYGNAFLSRLPVIELIDHRFTMSLPGEPRGAPELVVEVGPVNMRVFNTHLAPGRDSFERVDHVGQLRGLVASGDSEQPVVILGDLNDVPDRRMYRTMTAFVADAWTTADTRIGEGATHPAQAPRRRIDYIFVGQQVSVREVHTVDGSPSDHRAVVADLAVCN